MNFRRDINILNVDFKVQIFVAHSFCWPTRYASTLVRKYYYVSTPCRVASSRLYRTRITAVQSSGPCHHRANVKIPNVILYTGRPPAHSLSSFPKPDRHPTQSHPTQPPWSWSVSSSSLPLPKLPPRPPPLPPPTTNLPLHNRPPPPAHPPVKHRHARHHKPDHD